MATIKIEIYRSDLLTNSKNKPMIELSHEDVNGTILPKWLRDRADLIEFVDEEGDSIVWKYRYKPEKWDDEDE